MRANIYVVISNQPPLVCSLSLSYPHTHSSLAGARSTVHTHHPHTHTSHLYYRSFSSCNSAVVLFPHKEQQHFWFGNGTEKGILCRRTPQSGKHWKGIKRKKKHVFLWVINGWSICFCDSYISGSFPIKRRFWRTSTGEHKVEKKKDIWGLHIGISQIYIFWWSFSRHTDTGSMSIQIHKYTTYILHGLFI